MTAIDEHVQPVGRLLGIDHVQLAMPEGGEGAARGFYGGPLGMVEVAKPANLLARGGCWFEASGIRLHLGSDRTFAPARKAHPAFLVDDLDRLILRLEESGVAIVHDEPLVGYATACFL
ncbi:glyoxalase [Ensifer sp. MJa1]|uniref:glyoxalase n=1 Tax=Ensifer sp. MJa1 TaxID=2919888 RepID=UPI003008961B